MTGMVGMNDPFAQLKGQRGNGWEFGTNTALKFAFNKYLIEFKRGH